MSKLTVLLTGPGGRIGPHLLPAFHAAYNLKLLDKNPVAGEPETVVTDLQDFEVLKAAMQGVDVVVHLAATSDEAPFLESLVPNNVIGLYNVYEAAHQAGVKRIVFASTVQTVGCYPGDVEIQIEDLPRPNTMYGATKVFGEALGRYYHDQRGMEFVAVRIGWFQPYDSEVMRQNKGGQNIWLSPRDCAGILQAAIEKPDVGYALVFATSKTPRERLSRQPARELLGYESQDDPNDYFGEAAPPSASS